MPEKEKILIIDDRHENLDFLTQYILHPAGYQTLVAYDGEQGLQKALQENPDLIIMDLRMPKMDGLQVLQALRKIQSDIPVILMTFHGSEETAVQAFRLGVKDYIVKPYKAEEMQQAVERALSERRLRRERDQLVDNVAAVNRRIERQVKELGVIISVGKSVTALLDQDRLLTRIVEAAVYITGAEEGFLLLVDEASGELYMRAARGLGEKYARGFRLKVEDSLAGQVIRTGKPLMLTGTARNNQLKLKTGYLVKSLLHVPIKVGETAIGVLSVDHMVEEQIFTEHDLHLLSALADYAAIALENARLYGRLQQQVQDIASRRAEAGAPTEAVPPDSVRAIATTGQALLAELRDKMAGLETWLQNLDQSLVAPQPSASPTSPVYQVESVINSILDGVLIIDQNRRVVIANQVAQDILGRGTIGRLIGQIGDDPRWEKTFRIVLSAAQMPSGEPGSEIESAVTPLRIAERTYRAWFNRIASPGRQSASVLVVLRDVETEQEAQRAKDSFVTSISQELRTPVTSILGYTDLLLSDSLGMIGDTHRKFLNRIRVNAERMGSLLNDLIGITIIDSRQFEIKTENVDVSSVIRLAADALRSQIAEKEQTLDLRVPPNLPTVQGDADAVYQVLTSLLQNAHQCSPEKSRLRLEAAQAQESHYAHVLISVTDAGGGIAPADQKKVFNRFYLSDDPHIPGLGTPGVSLSIAKSLVEAHGGRVWLDSKMGVGCTFTFILPVQRPVPDHLFAR